MQTTRLIKRSLAYYWQTNLVVVLGVAIAVSVLAGALLIGESVRGSLRDLSARRLGNTDDLISVAEVFPRTTRGRSGTARAVCRERHRRDVPMIAIEGVVVHESEQATRG